MKHIGLWVVLLLLMGCSGGGGSSRNVEPRLPSSAFFPDQPTGLRPVGTDAAFQAYILTGLKQWTGVADNSSTVDALLGERRGEPYAVTHVGYEPEVGAAVYDGNHLYLASGDHLQVVDTQSGGPGEIVSTLDLADRLSYPPGLTRPRQLHTYADTTSSVVVQLRTHYVPLSLVNWDPLWYLPHLWNDSVYLDFVDVTEPQRSEVVAQAQVDGTFVGSREVGHTLYVVTRFTPGSSVFRQVTGDRDHDRALVDAIDLDEAMPQVRFRDGATVPLVASSDCLVPAKGRGSNVYYPTITAIAAFDLRAPGEFSSICVAEGVTGMYVASDAVYFSAYPSTYSSRQAYFESTTIHKFSIAGGKPAYVGSARLAGTFRGDPARLMAEHGDALVALTADSAGDEWSNHLTLLGEVATESGFGIIGYTANAGRPAPVGDANEEIYAIRIAGNRVYVEPDEKTQSMQVIDVSDHAHPGILGSLALPETPVYVHPLGEDLLLVLGRDVLVEDGIAREQGVRVRLMDVRTPGAPSVAGEIVVGRRGTFMPIERRATSALTVVADGDLQRIAIPIRAAGAHLPAGSRPASSSYPWTDSSLYLFEVDARQRTLAPAGRVIAQDEHTGRRTQAYCCDWNDRSFVHDDRVLYLFEARLFTTTWQEPSVREDLFIPTLFKSPSGITNGSQCITNQVSWVDAWSPGHVVSISLSASDRDQGGAVADCVTWRIDGVNEAFTGDPCSVEPGTRLLDAEGVFNLTVTAAGFQPWHTTDVHVQADDCHVGTVEIKAPMTRE